MGIERYCGLEDVTVAVLDRNLMGNVSSLFLLVRLNCFLDTNLVGV